MKITKEQKEMNRRSLLNAGIELMREEGLKTATMRRIALKAGLSEPVIYKYFPTKDHLLIAFFSDSIDAAIIDCEKLPDFFELSLSEQIQLIFESQMSQFSKNREFVRAAFDQLFLTTLSGSFSFLAQQRERYTNYIQRLLEAASDADEIQRPPSTRLVSDLLWDFHLGMTYYWLKDESLGQQKSMQLIDKALNLFSEVLKSNIMNRVVDLFYFFAREHFLKLADGMSELSTDQKNKKSRFLKNEK